MEFISRWFDYKLRPYRTFDQHFKLSHEFHGIKLHRISESYYIHPKSLWAVQLFHDGIRFPSVDLHLKSKINYTTDQIKIDLDVFDPSISQYVVDEVKNYLINQLINFQEIMNADPAVNYVQSFCKKCLRENTKPFNICVQTCMFERKKH